MKAKIIIEGKNRFAMELSYEDISSIVNDLPDSTACAELYRIFAEHPAVSVRKHIAFKDKLDAATVNLLAKDKDISVIRALFLSENAQKFMETGDLMSVVERDVEAAVYVASNFEKFVMVDEDQLFGVLVNHADPMVRDSLASNSNAPNKLLKAFLKDNDPKVRSSAKQALHG